MFSRDNLSKGKQWRKCRIEVNAQKKTQDFVSELLLFIVLDLKAV